jgi:hypothetical protein
MFPSRLKIMTAHQTIYLLNIVDLLSICDIIVFIMQDVKEAYG